VSITEETRRESYWQLDNVTLNQHILNVLESGKMTAREIAIALHEKRYIPYPIRQATAPRLTEMAEEGKVKVVGKVYDEVTKRNVAVYELVRE
jgi:hypothetical protein